MRPAAEYAELLKRIDDLLKARGFHRKGSAFVARRGDNWLVIDFQKSRKSTAAEIIFTVNVGVSSRRLVEFFTPDRIDSIPPIEECHWWERAGALLRGNQDVWWSITDSDSAAHACQEVEEFLDKKGLPAIEAHATDEQLAKLWLSGRGPGLTAVQRLRNLAVLLREIGSNEQLEPVLRELEMKTRGKPMASSTRELIQTLETPRE